VKIAAGLQNPSRPTVELSGSGHVCTTRMPASRCPTGLSDGGRYHLAHPHSSIMTVLPVPTVSRNHRPRASFS
jgi:hypothetical protein